MTPAAKPPASSLNVVGLAGLALSVILNVAGFAFFSGRMMTTQAETTKQVEKLEATSNSLREEVTRLRLNGSDSLQVLRRELEARLREIERSVDQKERQR